MSRLVHLNCWFGLWSPALWAHELVTLIIEPRSDGYEIPSEFAGVSINKEHGSAARTSRVKIPSPRFPAGNAASMLLTAGNSGIEATNGVTLGGGTIANNAPWDGKWMFLEVSKESCIVTVPAASATVVRISR